MLLQNTSLNTSANDLIIFKKYYFNEKNIFFYSYSTQQINIVKIDSKFIHPSITHLQNILPGF